MSEKTADAEAIGAFIDRWERSGAAERSNHQLFISELCDLLGVSHPDPATPDNSKNSYIFERSITFQHGDGTSSTGFIDLYKRGCFVLEAKQGADEPDAGEVLSEAAQELKRKLKAGHGRRGTGAWDDAMLRARGQGQPARGRHCRARPLDRGVAMAFSEINRDKINRDRPVIGLTWRGGCGRVGVLFFAVWHQFRRQRCVWHG